MRTANFKSVSEYLPSTVKQAIGQPPVCELIKVTGKASIVLYLQFELIQLSQRISVGGNLNNAQIEFIAIQLVEFFPGESLADFKICFQRGAIGQYGEIFRMDGIVIRKWMEQYLEEKYTIVEEELRKEKETIWEPKQVKTADEKHREHLANWLDAVKGTGQKIPGMTDEEIKENGKEQPPRKSAHTAGWAYFTVEGYKIYAGSQEQAEEQYAIMVKNKMIKSEKACPAQPTSEK